MVVGMEKRYSISDAARQVNVEAHVLRYWEEELDLHIPRNAQGHRIYRDQDIHILHKIKEWKEQGFLLRSIRRLLPDMARVEKMTGQELYALRQELNQRVQMEEEHHKHSSMGKVMEMPIRSDSGTGLEDVEKKEEKLEKFQTVLREMMQGMMQESWEESEKRITDHVTENLTKEMNYLMREKEELQEKQIDILQQILVELKPDKTREIAATEEVEVQTIQTRDDREKKKEARKRWLHLPI